MDSLLNHPSPSQAISAITCQDLALCCKMARGLNINRHRGLVEECFLHASTCPNCRIDGVHNHLISTTDRTTSQEDQDYRDMFRLDIGWNVPEPSDKEFEWLAQKLTQHHLSMVRAFIAARLGDWPVPRKLRQLQYQVLTGLLYDPHHYVVEMAGRGLVTVGIPSQYRQQVIDAYRIFAESNPDFAEQADSWLDELDYFRLV